MGWVKLLGGCQREAAAVQGIAGENAGESSQQPRRKVSPGELWEGTPTHKGLVNLSQHKGNSQQKSPPERQCEAKSHRTKLWWGEAGWVKAPTPTAWSHPRSGQTHHWGVSCWRVIWQRMGLREGRQYLPHTLRLCTLNPWRDTGTNQPIERCWMPGEQRLGWNQLLESWSETQGKLRLFQLGKH